MARRKATKPTTVKKSVTTKKTTVIKKPRSSKVCLFCGASIEEKPVMYIYPLPDRFDALPFHGRIACVACGIVIEEELVQEGKMQI